MVADLARKFRILADIVQTVESEKNNVGEIKTTLSSGDLKKTEIESMVRLAKEFGFISENQQHNLHSTKSGLAFERYVTAINSLVMASDSSSPKIDRGTELRVCITVPPMWNKEIDERLRDVLSDTLTGQRLVAEDADTRLFIVTPFLDVSVMQIALKDIYAKNAELIILTSEESLMKKYPGGTNYKLKKLSSLVKARFGSGRILFFNTDASIAHAKVWCSDRSVLVTSANVKADSATENLEIGIYTDDPELVSTMCKLLDQILTMGGMPCLKIPP